MARTGAPIRAQSVAHISPCLPHHTPKVPPGKCVHGAHDALLCTKWRPSITRIWRGGGDARNCPQEYGGPTDMAIMRMSLPANIETLL